MQHSQKQGLRTNQYLQILKNIKLFNRTSTSELCFTDANPHKKPYFVQIYEGLNEIHHKER